MIKALWDHVTPQVPFADDRRLIANVLEQLGKCLLRPVELVSIHHKSVQVRILAGLNDSSHRTTNAIGHVAATKQNSISCNAINIGSLVDTRTVRADRMARMIVGEDE